MTMMMMRTNVWLYRRHSLL